MDRQTRSFIASGLCLLTVVTGCQPQQPFFFREDGDLSHYLDVATDIEYADVQTCTLAEVQHAQAPRSLSNAEGYEWWDITLEEVTRITLENSEVIRGLGGRISDNSQNISVTSPQVISQNGGAAVVTTYDPALVESGIGTATGAQFSGTGADAATVNRGANDHHGQSRAANGPFTAANTDREHGEGAYESKCEKKDPAAEGAMMPTLAQPREGQAQQAEQFPLVAAFRHGDPFDRIVYGFRSIVDRSAIMMGLSHTGSSPNVTVFSPAFQPDRSSS